MLPLNLLMVTIQKYYPLPTTIFCKYAIIPRKKSFLFLLSPFPSMALYASIKFFSHDKSQGACVSFPRILLALIALLARAEALFHHNFIAF